eukprot:738870-Hanusia_phi.AAC.1
MIAPPGPTVTVGQWAGPRVQWLSAVTVTASDAVTHTVPAPGRPPGRGPRGTAPGAASDSRRL